MAICVMGHGSHFHPSELTPDGLCPICLEERKPKKVEASSYSSPTEDCPACKNHPTYRRYCKVCGGFGTVNKSRGLGYGGPGSQPNYSWMFSGRRY